MSLLVVIPARNEAASLPAVLDELARVRPELPVVVVDDHSTDTTPAVLEERRVPHLRLPLRLGVGGAVRAGLRYALERRFDGVVRLDADGQHPPSSIGSLFEPIAAGRAAAACGSRYLRNAGEPTTLSRRLVQHGLAWSISSLTRQRVTDPTSGLWCFGSEALGFLARHHPTGYPEPELHLLLHRNGLRVEEVSIPMRARLAGRSSLTPGPAALALARALLALIVVPLRSTVTGKTHA